MIPDALRLIRTARYLRPVQIYARLAFRLSRPHSDLSAAPALRPRPHSWERPARHPQSLTGPSEFNFLNERGSLGENGWDDPAKTKLWRYNQHYFQDLVASQWRRRAAWHRALIKDWIFNNAPGQGTGWEPYPTSLRIINWIKWARAGGHLDVEALQSLSVQARWLEQRLEWHLLGNHLFLNAKALTFAGAFFEGAEAERWLARGSSILEKQLEEQFLSDGGQFELSPMYHSLALEDLLDLSNLSTAFPEAIDPALVAKARSRAESAVAWLKTMTHPDGEIAFFNDAGFGVAPSPAELFAYAKRLGIAVPSERSASQQSYNSGYVRFERGPIVLLADLARIGPDYLPGHAHADTLSFELSFLKQRLFVNSGVSEYGTGSERQRQRGTAAHNTVIIAGQNSSEVWSGFRVGRRAVPHGVKIGEHEGELFAQASHDGYRYLKGRPQHHRRFRVSDDRFIVEDSVPSHWPAEARYHLHPAVCARLVGPQSGRLSLPDGRSLEMRTWGGLLRLERSTWHPEFGMSIANKCLVLPLKNGSAQLELTWAE